MDRCIKIARDHARIRDTRLNHIHQFPTATIRENHAGDIDGLNVITEE